MSNFTEMDCYLFGQATHYDIYRKMGAHKMTIEGEEGVCFDVWAPHADRVYVIGEFNGWNETSHEMKRVTPETMGVYELFVPGVQLGCMYKFLIIAQDGRKLYKADPYANYAQLRPETASIVTDISNFTWSDSAWMDIRKKLSKEEVQRRLDAGEPHVIRFNMPTEGTTTFHDEIYGDITVDNAELDDMVLIKSDGYPTYNFANVVDDHLMKITHVVRGNEYLSSSPKYNRLYDAFGWKVPVYVHCPTITNEEHKKLSKRSGHSSFEDLLEQGFLTEAIVNFVALLGWSPTDNQEFFTLEELVKAFDYHNMSKSPAVFDMTKLRWMNGEYIKKMDDGKFFELAKPYLEAAIKKPLDLKKIAGMVKTRIETLCDIADQVDFFEEMPEYSADMYIHKKMKTTKENSLETLKEVLPILEEQDDFSNDALFEALSKYVADKGVKTGFVMWPIRTAVSGKQMTPAGATEIMEIIGKEESLTRIRKGIELLEAAE